MMVACLKTPHTAIDNNPNNHQRTRKRQKPPGTHTNKRRTYARTHVRYARCRVTQVRFRKQQPDVAFPRFRIASNPSPYQHASMCSFGAYRTNERTSVRTHVRTQVLTVRTVGAVGTVRTYSRTDTVVRYINPATPSTVRPRVSAGGMLSPQ